MLPIYEKAINAIGHFCNWVMGHHYNLLSSFMSESFKKIFFKFLKN